eukprot:s1870_g13.t1
MSIKVDAGGLVAQKIWVSFLEDGVGEQRPKKCQGCTGEQSMVKSCTSSRSAEEQSLMEVRRYLENWERKLRKSTRKD